MADKVNGIDLNKINFLNLNEILVGNSNPFLKLVKAINPSDISIRTPQESVAANIRMQNLLDKVSSLLVDLKPFLTQLALNTYDLLNPTLQTSIDTTVLNFNSNSNNLANVSSPFTTTTLMNTAVLNLSLDTTPLTFLDLLLQQLVLQIEDTNSEIRARADKAEKQEKLAKGFGIAGAAGDLLNSFLPEKQEYSGRKGAITAGMDEAYDQLADAAAKFGPIGSIVSGAMKVNAGLGKVANLTGAGTDAMTVQDAIFGSNFLGPLGWVNGWGGRTTSTITKDNEAFAQVGSSYGGTENTVDEALEVSGKKYGLLSNGARRRAERQLAEARRLQNIIQGISEDALIRSTLQGTMSNILSNRYGLLLQGGYNQGAIHVGKKGLKVSPYKAKRLTSNVNFKLYPKSIEKEQLVSYIEPTDFIITTFKEGGSVPTKVGTVLEPAKIETIIEPVKIETEIAPIELDLIETFLNGGEINIIPDGALHKNLHHMEDAENLTKKGIPVVAVDNGELVAEIETSEIILRKSVTEQLEEWCKLYYSDDNNKKEKDEYALEAGELLVDEILNNTIDRTNKLL